MFEPTEAPAASLRKNQSSDDLVRDAQVRGNENTLFMSSREKKKILERFVNTCRNNPS